ncbi:MAG: transposase [Curvibacter sp. RIFCSPHIGHO2_12_FULL_63_18]|uniref:TniB family NTP-binding protein n=1 Tax=Rhodoferax sp. TaxID=50421 RepID=UPI0008B6689C|nr:TniB family NTP-binding protein [Rhodoferax sp.]OGO97509.1 MAG: transposase [Curvibacter sp. GWA2_63_95]OGO98746.1 MAG: transposase [Curvibacter sp. RIFCSPHIGHO2_12_FULL_63_18]
MSDQADFPHLNDAARVLIHASDAQRIHAIRSGTWLGYARAKEIMARMEDLLEYPRITRMPNMLLVAPSFNGKTSILERFLALHPPDLDPEGETTICPVLMVEAPPSPDVSSFYSRTLDALMTPYKPTASVQEKNSQIKLLFKQMGVKMLVVDEIHHLIAGSLNKQRDFRNALKSLGNETKVVIVAAGTEDAYNAFNTDPQMSSRFTPEELPLWRADKQFGALLATLELRSPLKKPSNLKDPAKMLEMHSRSEGTLGDMCDLFKELAVDAIRSQAEEITLDSIRTLRWVPPSKRKQYRRL